MSVALKGTGSKMPLVGLGTWKIAKDVCPATVYNAIKLGYRHLDCACDYGNEVEVGQGIKKAISEGIVKREDLWVTSKLWNTYHAKKNVKAACEKTLKDLDLEYLDLYLIHFPISLKYVPIDERYPPEWDFIPGEGCVQEDVTYRETWEGMEELVGAGLCKNIGVANYSAALLMDLHKYAKVTPAVLQIEFHPYLQRPKLIEFAKSKGMAITAFSSFGAASYLEIFDWAKDIQPLLTHETIQSIADKHKMTTAQVLLRFATQQDIIVIPKSCNDGRLTQNLENLKFDLDDDDMAALKKLDRNLYFNDPGSFANIPIWN